MDVNDNSASNAHFEHQNELWDRLSRCIGEDARILASVDRTMPKHLGPTWPRESFAEYPSAISLHANLGTLSSPNESAVEDGKYLAQQCLQDVDAKSSKPKLFVLWATPSFSPYEELLSGVHTILDDYGLSNVPLVGSSVSVCNFHDHPHEKGGILIALGSDQMAVRTASVDVDQDGAAIALLKQLRVVNKGLLDLHDNQWLMIYVAGYPSNGDPERYLAPEFVDSLRKATYGRLRLFGGVSSGGLEKYTEGYQFLNGDVYTRRVVAALFTAGNTCGIGISHGLRPTGHSFRVENLGTGSDRVIESFEEGTATDIFDRIAAAGPEFVFRVKSRGPDETILVPKKENDCLKMQRSVSSAATLEVMRTSAKGLKCSVGRVERCVRESMRIPNARVGAILAIGCTSRYRASNLLGFDLQSALESVGKRYPGSVYAGCYMDGEIGVNAEGRSVLCNWSMSEAFLADDAPAIIPDGLGLTEVLAGQTDSVPSVEAAVEVCLNYIQRCGYLAAMISFVHEYQDTSWIVAQDAKGSLWRKQVVPRTRRELLGRDILAIAAQRKKDQLVRDATIDPHCDNEAARAGGVYSFYAYPVLDANEEVIAVVSIDLGVLIDSMDLQKEQVDNLRTVAATVATILNNAIQSEEIRLLRSVDDAMAKSACRSSRDAIIQTFVQEVGKALRAECHVRLLTPENKLRLAGGCGQYFDLAQEFRREIDPQTDPSPSALAFNERRLIVVNDAFSDPMAQGGSISKLMESIEGTQLAEALEERVAFANFPIIDPYTEEAMGVMTFSSQHRWSFTQLQIRLLRDLSQRLETLLKHAHAIETLTKIRRTCESGTSDDSSMPINRLAEILNLVKT